MSHAPWLGVPARNALRPPGRVLRSLGRLFASPGGRELDGASPAYFEWQSGTAAGAWQYYSGFLRDGPRLVLDVGAGASGRTAVHAAACPAAFVCLDRSPALLASAQREGRQRDLGSLRPVAGDAYSLPFADHTFDAALCENALEHLERPDAALAEIHRVLKGGGRLFLLFPPWRSPYAGHLRWLTWLPWIHLLPDRLRAGLLGGILLARSGQAEWEDETRRLLGWLAGELNGWPLRRILRAVTGAGGLGMLGAYVLGEGALGRALRFLPWSGELFAGAVYLALEKRPDADPPPRTYNGLLLWTLRGWWRRRGRRAG